MPYFPKHHILFVHIPKTGGTSIECCLGDYNGGTFVNPNVTLYTRYGKNDIIPNPVFQSFSLQHQFYSTLYMYRKECDVVFDNALRVVSCVRNPYDRAMSALFYHKLVTRGSSPEEVCVALDGFLRASPETYDNHATPQYKFITDDTENVYDNITVLRTETLSQQMKEYGFEIKRHLLRSKVPCYDDYLNEDSRAMIRQHYEKDFTLFGYDKKEPS